MSFGGSGGNLKYSEISGQFPDPPRYWAESAVAPPAGGAAAGDVEEEEEYESEDELEEEEAGDEGIVWKLKEPQPQPLCYQIPAANGGFEDRYISSQVDSASSDSVNKAKKQRRLAIYGAKMRHGLQNQILRPSTKGREYTQAHDTYITQQHQSYAAANNNKRIPWTDLINRFDVHFPGQNWTKNSLSGYVDQRAVWKGMRAQCDGADDE